MNELTAPIIRFRHAAEAIGVTKKTLRNWLVRGQVKLDEPSEGWNTFSRLDLIRLALTAELVRYGVGIIPAFVSAGSEVSRVAGLLERYRSAPSAALVPAFRGHKLLVQRTPDGKTSFFHAAGPLPTPDDWDEPSLLVIDMEILAQRVIDRLIEALDDEDDSDD